MKVAFRSDAQSYRITLDAAPLNILDVELLEQLHDALKRVAPDRHTLVIDARGARAFSAGVSVQDHAQTRIAQTLQTFHDCFRMLARIDVITIAQVRGVALGGGCELALACDFVLASGDATFGYPEIKLGAFPPIGAWQMSRQLAPRKGLELLLTGDPIDATTAERLSLVNAVFPTEKFDEQCDAWRERLHRHSASSLRFAKRAYRIAQADDFETRLAAVERLYLDELTKTRDAEEGLNAFLEKRAPQWSGS
jgi:cyclohexa-1,5-dienecarbonyl-CoA hydratase